MFKIFSKKNLLLAILIIILLGGIFLVFKIFKKPRVCFEKTCFKVELAATEVARNRGLMNHSKLKSDQGMLFIFPQNQICNFWMKNMTQDIDMIFLDENKKINFIAAKQKPCIFSQKCPLVTSPANTHYVLEIADGTAQKLNLRIGDQWQWDF